MEVAQMANEHHQNQVKISQLQNQTYLTPARATWEVPKRNIFVGMGTISTRQVVR